MGGRAKTVTFAVTDDCQLRCKYCYFPEKDNKKVLTIDIAKKTIDYLLSNREKFNESSVIIDFIGGEPFLEIELIDQICDYFKIESFKINHPWFEKYRFSFSTNGLLYSSNAVQNFVKKNRKHVDIGITIDGTEKKHDLQRIFPDGSGSYSEVYKNIPLWLEQFPEASTKVTISRDDLAYLKESVLHLWEIGIKNVNANIVFEDVWQQGDEKLFESQLRELADVILQNDLYKDHSCSLFQKSIGKPLNSNGNWCGAGKMLCVDYKGDFYPCIRFTPQSMINYEGRKVGNYKSGIDFNKIRPFEVLTTTVQSEQKCIDCEVATGCAWCQGCNYDFAKSPTIYERAIYICEMHKARVSANNYFWERYEEKVKVDE